MVRRRSQFSWHPVHRLALAGLLGAAPVVAAAPAFAEHSPRIVGGHLESRWPAIGALLSDGEWFCSGTAIGGRVVLTAAHCLDGIPGKIEFFMGADANQPNAGRRVIAQSIHPHPNYTIDDNYDVGIVVLGEEVGVETLPARLTPLDASIIGREATFVGYGLTVHGGDGGEKRSVDIAIGEINDFFIGFNSTQTNTCNGDSGGPALMDLGRGLEVIGVTSYGDAGCVENSFNTRTDVFAPWIQSFLDGDIPAAPTIPDMNDGGDTVDAGGDICADFGWYDDDYCDTECAQPDPDCADGGSEDGWDWTGDDGDAGEEGTDEGGDGNKRPSDEPVLGGLEGCSGGTAPLGLGATLAVLIFLVRRRVRWA